MENKKHYLFEIKPFFDSDGYLAVIEENNQIPFSIKRIFYEYGFTENNFRGKHANRNSRFCMIAVSGSCEVIIEDEKDKHVYVLDSPIKVLFVDSMVWKTMTNFSKDCVLLVLSDHLYDKDEYIRDFQEFVSLAKE